MHFEEIWTEAEKFSEQLEEEKLEDIVKTLHSRIDKLLTYANLPKEQGVNIGEILFEISRVSRLTELKTETNINVAAAMLVALENRKSEVLDPDDESVDSITSDVPNDSSTG